MMIDLLRVPAAFAAGMLWSLSAAMAAPATDDPVDARRPVRRNDDRRGALSNASYVAAKAQ